MIENKEKELTYERVEGYLKDVYLPIWSKWVHGDFGKPGIEIMDFKGPYTSNNPPYETYIDALVEFYPNGSKEDYHKLVFGIDIQIPVKLNDENKAIDILGKNEEPRSMVQCVTVYGTNHEKLYNVEERKFTRKQDKITKGKRDNEPHTFSSSNGSNIIMYATRGYKRKLGEVSRNNKKIKENNLKRVETKEDLTRLERFYKLLKDDELYKVELIKNSIKGIYIQVNSPLFKDTLFISPNYIVTSNLDEIGDVLYNKYDSSKGNIKKAKNEYRKRLGYGVKDVKRNWHLEKFFKMYEVSNDLRRKVK